MKLKVQNPLPIPKYWKDNMSGASPEQMRAKKRCGVPCRAGGAQLATGRGQSGLGLQLRELCSRFPPLCAHFRARLVRAFAGGGALPRRWSHVRVRSSVGQEILSHFAGQTCPPPHIPPKPLPSFQLLSFLKTSMIT